jgi:hypothetical protein
MSYSATFKSELLLSQTTVTNSLTDTTFQMGKTYGYIYMDNHNKLLVTFGVDNPPTSPITLGQSQWTIQAIIDLSTDIPTQIAAILV